MPGSREEDLLRNTSILHFLLQNYLPFGWGVMKFTIYCLLTLRILHTKTSIGILELMLMHKAQGMMDVDRCQPTAIGHLNEAYRFTSTWPIPSEHILYNTRRWGALFYCFYICLPMLSQTSKVPN